MASIKQVAEQAYRICYANPTGDATNRMPEFELMTIAALAGTYKIEYYQLNSEGEKTVCPQWLKQIVLKAEKDSQHVFKICLTDTPMNLPNDLGVYKVKPNSFFAGSYVKSTLGNYELYGTLKTGKRYFRIGNEIFFPDGLLGENAETFVVYVSTGSVDCDDENTVPQDLVIFVINEVKKQFFDAKGGMQDKAIDGADQSKRQA